MRGRKLQLAVTRDDQRARVRVEGAAVREVEATRARGPGLQRSCEALATEEPVEIRVNGDPFAVVMRTPGADIELVAGFLLAERIIRGPDDLARLEPATRRGTCNVVLAEVPRLSRSRAAARRRKVVTGSSCGICGRVTIESVRIDAPPVAASWTMSRATLTLLPDRLRERQPAFDATGGLHAAALFTPGGECVIAAEDVGRHNAVDKVVGSRLLAGCFPLCDYALAVSGRASFEIVQKALAAAIPIVAAVSAPSTLAVDLARESGITLAAFVRDGGFTLYSHPWRVT